MVAVRPQHRCTRKQPASQVGRSVRRHRTYSCDSKCRIHLCSGGYDCVHRRSHVIALVLTQPLAEFRVYSMTFSAGLCQVSTRRLLSMRNRPLTIAYGVMLVLGMAGPAIGQDNEVQQPTARQQLQHIHTPQSIDQKLAQLTKDLELTPEQQRQVKPLLEEHHDRIQALLDKNPTATRQELGPQIHTISDETHGKIHALLTKHQKELEKAMQQREHDGEETRRSAPPAAPIASPTP